MADELGNSEGDNLRLRQSQSTVDSSQSSSLSLSGVHLVTQICIPICLYVPFKHNSTILLFHCTIFTAVWTCCWALYKLIAVISRQVKKRRSGRIKSDSPASLAQWMRTQKSTRKIHYRVALVGERATELFRGSSHYLLRLPLSTFWVAVCTVWPIVSQSTTNSQRQHAQVLLGED